MTREGVECAFCGTAAVGYCQCHHYEEERQTLAHRVIVFANDRAERRAHYRRILALYPSRVRSSDLLAHAIGLRRFLPPTEERQNAQYCRWYGKYRDLPLINEQRALKERRQQIDD